MESLRELASWLLHVDEHLKVFLDHYGTWTYALLFVIILCETGLVVTPFLPGDSLLFAAGMFAGLYPDALNIYLLLFLLSLAAILGDTINYWVGAWIGPRAFSGKIRFLKPAHLERTQAFYVKYGGRAIVLGRWVPIVRTFVPFVAGIGAMNYRQFIRYNIFGGILWVGVCTLAGYWLGKWKVIQENFEFAVILIILASILPMAWEFFAERRYKHPPDSPNS